ncbi:MAG: hypothetical protein KAS49_08310 [Candidatus Cloacimonetes bacterium]|nr:hypothetical protein [Candidatus Cloacimonadota bacterium]
MEKINIFINTKESFTPKAKYVFETIFRILGKKTQFFTEFTMQNIHIYYGEKTSDKYPINIYHNPEAADFFSKRKLYNEDEANLVKYGDEYIPFLFSKQGKITHYTAKSAELRKDIISSAFYFLSCWQEYASEKLIEPSNFFQHSASLQYIHGFTEIPVVDRYCEILQGMLVNILSDYVVDNIWENNNNFALSLSHNIDYWKYWTDEHIEALRARKDKFFSKKNLFKIIRLFIQKIGMKWFDTTLILRLVIRHEKNIKAASSFFILTHDQFPDKRMNYFSDDASKKQLVQILKDTSINLQGTKEAGYQEDHLRSELEKMSDFSAKGFRVRYLNFNYQNLFTVLEKEKIEFDSSMGFYEAIGFRAGISYPFYPFNIAENRSFNVLEIPVVVTDRSLFKLTNGDVRKAKRKVFDLLKSAEKHHSHISIIWHNHIFDRIDYPGWGKLYWRINKFDRNKGRWICSVDDVAKFWMKR